MCDVLHEHDTSYDAYALQREVEGMVNALATELRDTEDQVRSQHCVCQCIFIVVCHLLVQYVRLAPK